MLGENEGVARCKRCVVVLALTVVVLLASLLLRDSRVIHKGATQINCGICLKTAVNLFFVMVCLSVVRLEQDRKSWSVATDTDHPQTDINYK